MEAPPLHRGSEGELLPLSPFSAVLHKFHSPRPHFDQLLFTSLSHTTPSIFHAHMHQLSHIHTCNIFTNLLTRSLTCSLTHPLMHPLVHPLTPSLTHPYTPSLTLSLTLSLHPSLPRLLTHLLSYTHTHTHTRTGLSLPVSQWLQCQGFRGDGGPRGT